MRVPSSKACLFPGVLCSQVVHFTSCSHNCHAVVFSLCRSKSRSFLLARKGGPRGYIHMSEAKDRNKRVTFYNLGCRMCVYSDLHCVNSQKKTGLHSMILPVECASTAFEAIEC